MAKKTYDYRTTPAMWAAAQARGYLLESSNPHMTWTHLTDALRPNTIEAYFHVPGIGSVLASVELEVAYERTAQDWTCCPGLIARSQIPIADVTVI